MVPNKSKHYVNSSEFHAEMCRCKKNGELSNAAIESLYKIAENYAPRVFKFADDSIYKDAIQAALLDCVRYWRNFKEGSVCTVKLNRTPKGGEGFIININNKPPIPVLYGGPDLTLNEYLEYLIHNHGVKSGNSYTYINDVAAIYINKSKKTVTFMDMHNESTKDSAPLSTIKIIDGDGTLIKDVHNGDPIPMSTPGNAFSYFTSMIRNGVLKLNNKVYKKMNRDTEVVSLNSTQEIDGRRLVDRI